MLSKVMTGSSWSSVPGPRRAGFPLVVCGALISVAVPASSAWAQPPARHGADSAPLPALPAEGATPAADTEPAAPPAAGMPAQAQGPAWPAAPIDIQKVYEHVRRGVVAVVRNGVPCALGTVLGGDGRVLTALSGLGGSEQADVRYADGTTVHAKVGEKDTALDLALLVPQKGKWTEGLNASEVDPTGAELRALLPGAHGAPLGPVSVDVKGQADTHARDGQSLLNLLDVDLKGPPIAGAPLLDSAGNVVAVLVRSCKGPGAANPTPKELAACVPVVVGAPVAAVRSFLSRAPVPALAGQAPPLAGQAPPVAGQAAPAAAPASPWLGIRGETETTGAVRGVRVTAVAPSSPAEKAGLKPGGDVIAAVDGKPIDSPEKLAEAIAAHALGDSVKLLVFDGSKFREPAVALRAAP
jgi:serine protease Do